MIYFNLTFIKVVIVFLFWKSVPRVSPERGKDIVFSVEERVVRAVQVAKSIIIIFIIIFEILVQIFLLSFPSSILS